MLAHRNRFNLWTAGPDQFFFTDEDECERMMERILTDEAAVSRAGAAARERAAADFAWADVLGDYEHELAVLGGHVPVRERRLPVRLAIGSGSRP